MVKKVGKVYAGPMEYTTYWLKREPALRLAKKYAKLSGHDVKLEYISAGDYSIKDLTVSRTPCNPHYVRIHFKNHKPYKFTVHYFAQKRGTIPRLSRQKGEWFISRNTGKKRLEKVL